MPIADGDRPKGRKDAREGRGSDAPEVCSAASALWCPGETENQVSVSARKKNKPEKRIVARCEALDCEAHTSEIRRLFALALRLRFALTARAFVRVIERQVRVRR